MTTAIGKSGNRGNGIALLQLVCGDNDNGDDNDNGGLRKLRRTVA